MVLKNRYQLQFLFMKTGLVIRTVNGHQCVRQSLPLSSQAEPNVYFPGKADTRCEEISAEVRS